MNLKLLFAFIGLFFTGSSFAQVEVGSVFTYQDNISYTVTNLERQQVYGSDFSMTRTSIDGVATCIILNFDNESEDEITIDFKRLRLKTDKGNVYNVVLSVQAYWGSKGDKFSYKLQSGDTRKYIIYFRPDVPEDETLVSLAFDDDIPEIIEE
ncbi:hypothetical protein E0W68_06325 [Flavobacterium salilacus subsp. salilacus]|uniref:hypothetical protein n=1 Tax=Flavobacterium TaxID=237 RepID=UPI001074E846|nr:MULTISPECIES: hypothetical protein [Flavobacterium]KAF2518868.1 hypothetical protein E0W68_06325 [Flavobacterium salilacus subsp. salilacus]MBE1614972.1 hypothetical protein [Flavobacterium sp. SaA2.13]